MDVTIVGRDIKTLNLYTGIYERMVGTSGTHLVGEGIECLVTVDVESIARLRLPYLEQCVGQHGLIVVVWVSSVDIVPLAGSQWHTTLFLEYQLVLSHRGVEYVVSHEHVQGIPAVGIVVARAHGVSLLTDVVIPCSGTTINFICIVHEVLETVDAVGTHHLITLGKDGIANLALCGTIKLTSVSVSDVCWFVKLRCSCTVGECAVLHRLLNRVNEPSLSERLIEDGVALKAVEGVAQQTGRAWHYPIELVYQTVGHLIVLTDNG